MLDPILHKQIRYIAIRATTFWRCPTDHGCRFPDFIFSIALLLFAGFGGDEGGCVGGGEIGFPGWIQDGELSKDFGIGSVEGDWGTIGVGLNCPGSCCDWGCVGASWVDVRLG